MYLKSSSSSLFPTRWGSAVRILDLQDVLSWPSSGVIRYSCMSLGMPSIHLPLGLPLALFPSTLMSTTALTSLFSSILCICPYTSVVSSLFLIYAIHSQLIPDVHILYFVSQCYTFSTSSSLFSRESVPPSF